MRVSASYERVPSPNNMTVLSFTLVISEIIFDLYLFENFNSSFLIQHGTYIRE